MSIKAAEIEEVPAALPNAEESDERAKLLREAAAGTNNLSDIPEIGEEEQDELGETPKVSKKKLFIAFVIFVLGFILLVVSLAWFFGIGSFAPVKPQAVDRTLKTSASKVAPVTEEEKLQMALNMVAEKNSDGSDNSSSDAAGTGRGNAEKVALDFPAEKGVDLNQPVVPDLPSGGNERIPENVSTSTPSFEAKKMPITNSATESRGIKNEPKITPSSDETNSALTLEVSSTPTGRSLFFGIERKEVSGRQATIKTNDLITSPLKPVEAPVQPRRSIPFGTILPVRFLGAVYTLRNSGGLVRMELTRPVDGKDFSYPAGTVLVGSVRGSEDRRAFISIVGLIDPETGGLVKLAGEVMGNDGGSGVSGRKRQIKGAWSRILDGFRDAGAVALGAIGSRRSGGTVVISDASSKVSDELGGLVGNDSKRSDFVEISAGTNAFVLVADLPVEVSLAETKGQTSNPVSGLSEREFADIFSEGNRETIRAAMPRMTPQFRVLAERYLANGN